MWEQPLLGVPSRAELHLKVLVIMLIPLPRLALPLPGHVAYTRIPGIVQEVGVPCMQSHLLAKSLMSSMHAESCASPGDT